MRRLWWNRSILPVVVGERTAVSVGDPVLPADPVEQDLDGLGSEPAREDLAVVGEDLVGDPVATKRGREHRTHRLGSRPRDQAGCDAVAAVVIDPGDDLQLGIVVEHDAAHHVHLPQLHGPRTLPAAELVTATASAPELDQAVAAQAPVDRRTRRGGVDPEAAELVLDPAGSPAGVFPSELADQGLGLAGGLVRAGGGSVGTVGERREAALLVAGDPGVDALARDAEAPGHLGDLPAVLHDREHRLVPLLHEAELHQHDGHLLPDRGSSRA